MTVHGRTIQRTFFDCFRFIEPNCKDISQRLVNDGGFGLKTDIFISSLTSQHTRKILRLAALFHDSGKLMGREGHIERSADMAEKALLSSQLWNVTYDEIQLIKVLILHNDVIGQYFKGRSVMTAQELISQLDQAYQVLHNQVVALKINKIDFCKLMFSLWIADASTLSIVNKTRAQHYRPLFEKMDDLDFINLKELIAAKSAFARII